MCFSICKITPLSNQRLVNLERGRGCFVGLSILLVLWPHPTPNVAHLTSISRDTLPPLTARCESSSIFLVKQRTIMIKTQQHLTTISILLLYIQYSTYSIAGLLPYRNPNKNIFTVNNILKKIV